MDPRLAGIANRTDALVRPPVAEIVHPMRAEDARRSRQQACHRTAVFRVHSGMLLLR